MGRERNLKIHVLFICIWIPLHSVHLAKFLIERVSDDGPHPHSPECRAFLIYNIRASHFACFRCWSHFTLYMVEVSPAFSCSEIISDIHVKQTTLLEKNLFPNFPDWENLSQSTFWYIKLKNEVYYSLSPAGPMVLLLSDQIPASGHAGWKNREAPVYYGQTPFLKDRLSLALGGHKMKQGLIYLSSERDSRPSTSPYCPG